MLRRILLLGTLPPALFATALVGPPVAQADDYENCELARQEYCYGAGNAFEDCYDETDPDKRAACMRSTVKLCETILVVVCEKLDGGPSSAGSVSYAVECPPGTQPDPLGRCVAKLRGRSDGPDLDPTDWCPPGFVPGPTDECVPAMHTVRFTPSSSGGWGVSCPPGSKPGPIGGCVLDLGVGEGTSGEETQCPPGMAPGPDDGCVPRTLVMNLGNIEGALAMDALNQSGTLAMMPEQSEQMLADVGVAMVSDPVQALEATAEAMGADVVDPGEPGQW
ncbi:MAG: hypothetical protein AAF799_06705 [Myxococcota bacterium]